MKRYKELTITLKIPEKVAEGIPFIKTLVSGLELDRETRMNLFQTVGALSTERDLVPTVVSTRTIEE